MTRLSFFTSFALVFGIAILLGACKRPVPPTIVPVEAQVVSIDGNGVELRLKVEATNTNAYALSAQRVSAKLTMDGKYDIGTTSIEKPVTLPPNVPTRFDVPIAMRWQNVGAVGEMAASGRDIPYTIDGTARIGGEHVNLDVPFTASGVVKRADIVRAAIRGIPLPSGPMLH